MKENAPELRRSSAVSIESTLKTVRDNLRTQAPYVPTGLCSLSLLITGVEPPCDLLESSQDSRFTLTEDDVNSDIKIDPNLFLSSECDLAKLNGLFKEIFLREKACLGVLEGIERELPIINSLVIKETHIRIIKEFLQKFKKVADTQKEFYRNMEIHQAAIPLNSREASKTAAALFLAIYDTNQFKEHIKALRSLINDWALMDTLLVEYKPICEEKKKELALPTLADDCRYAFGSRVVQIVSRREILAKELLKSLNLTDAEQIQRLLQCYKAIAYVPTCDNLLLSFKQDGYLRPSTLPSLTDTYFNAKRTNTLSHFLERSDNAVQQKAFFKYIADNKKSARLQFFIDMGALFKKKPWHVTDLQLLAPYFSGANPLKLDEKVLKEIQEALYNNEADASAKIKKIVTVLVPTIEAVSLDLTKMLRYFSREAVGFDATKMLRYFSPRAVIFYFTQKLDDFLTGRQLFNQLSEAVSQPAAKVESVLLLSTDDIKMRNKIATIFFEREIKNQISLLEDADIFHGGCFKGLVDLICQEILVPLLASEKDELQFLSRYAKALLEIPYYLMKALPKNFTQKRVDNETILSYNFCPDLNSDKTALHVQSLKNCLAKRATEYNAANREFLAQVESVTSVFELFNLIKERPDLTLYTTLKEDIRGLDRINASLFDKREKSVVPQTTKGCRTKWGKPLESNPGPETPSNTATPLPSDVRMKTTHVYNGACTPLRKKDFNMEKSPNFKKANGIIFSPNRIVFKNFIDYTVQDNKWDVKRYIKDDAEETSCDDPAKYNFVRTYEQAQLIFTAEKKKEQWTVVACSHREDHVNKMVSAMAKSVNSRSKTLDIAIVAPETEATELIETYIRTYVGAALEHGFLPVVTLNGKPFQSEELESILQQNESLVEKYREKSGLSKGGPVEISRNQHVWLSKPSARPESSAKRALRFEEPLAAQDQHTGFTYRQK